MVSVLDLMNHVQGGFDKGRARGQQTRLGELYSQAYSAAPEARNGLQAEIAKLDPSGARQLQGDYQKQDDDNRMKVFGMAKYVLDAYKTGDRAALQGAYRTVLPHLTEMGRESGTVPPAEFSEDMLPNLHQIMSQSGGSMGGDAESDSTPSAIRELQMLQDSPELYKMDIARRQAGWQPKTFESADGMAVFTPQTKTAAPLNYSGPQGDQGDGGQGGFGIAETDAYVRIILDKSGVDPNATPEQQAAQIMPHLIQQESGGDPNAVSPKGARGLTQVMPDTGRDPGFGVQPLRDDSPQENVRFGRDYLTAMLRRYPGRPDLALAAYNAGPGVADRFAQPQVQAGGGRVQAPVKQPSEIDQARLQLAQNADRRAEAKATASPAQIRDATTRKTKFAQAMNVDRGLVRINAAMAAMDKGATSRLFNTGPVDQFAQQFTKEGQELEAAVGGMQSSLLALTRVPGIGSQSDLEARVAMLQYPSLGKAPEVNARTAANLEAFTADLKAAYETAAAEDADLMGDATESTEIDTSDDESLFGKYLD